MSKKRILVLGASTKPERYSYKAAHDLIDHGYDLVAVGIKEGLVAGTEIITNRNIQPDIHTVTLYVGAQNQPEWYSYVLATKPQRIIFNPGTENAEFMLLAKKNGIEVIEACTLVMLRVGTFE